MVMIVGQEMVAFTVDDLRRLYPYIFELQT